MRTLKYIIGSVEPCSKHPDFKRIDHIQYLVGCKWDLHLALTDGWWDVISPRDLGDVVVKNLNINRHPPIISFL